MKYGVYCIRDFKTGFLPPQFDQNDGVAVRNFENAVLQSEQSLFFSHPADYAFYRVGEFDSDTAEIFPCTPVELITAPQIFQSAMTNRVKEVVANGNEGSKSL